MESFQRTIIPAMDVPIDQCYTIARALRDLTGINAFKVGMIPALEGGLARVVETIQEGFDGDVDMVYDGQKLGNDIPDLGGAMASRFKSSGVTSVILFPFAGPKTQREWTKACQGEGLRVLVGLRMTHGEFLACEGGYIADDAPGRAFRLACQQGVTDFVVPGNQLGWVTALRAVVAEELGEGNYVLHAPGFIDQGGDLTECGEAAGPRFHAFVGRDIHTKPTGIAMRAAAERLITKLA